MFLDLRKKAFKPSNSLAERVLLDLAGTTQLGQQHPAVSYSVACWRSADVVVNAATAEKTGFAGCSYLFEAIDSTDWIIMAQPKAVVSRLPPERVTTPTGAQGPAQHF